MEDRHDRSRFHAIIGEKQSSILQKYQDLVIGNRRVSTLCKFELVTLFFGAVPGTAGLFLRHLFYRTLFRQVGRKVAFGHHLTLRAPGKISIGNQVVIDDFVMLSARSDEDESIRIGDNVLIGIGSHIKTRHGSIHIKDFANISSYCHVGATSRVTIGHYCLVGSGCYIGGVQHGFERSDIPIVKQKLNTKGGVVIEDDVWMGARVIVNDGVTVGKGAVIGAGSIVTKDIPPYSVAVGVPAKVVKKRGQ